MFTLLEFSKQIDDLKNKAKQIFFDSGLSEYLNIDNNRSFLKIVFVGQFDAGKSTIVKMLTNNEMVEIGAGITTQKTNIYEWNGIEIVDTPGIHTEKRPDHDELTYNAIASADMLVFVVTQELFDSNMAYHFRKLAIDNDKAGEMIIVVNKMSKTSEGNTIEQQNVLRENINNVIKPYKSEQLSLCFLDAKSYIDGMNCQDDVVRRDKLIARSGYEAFVNTLNVFIKNKGTLGKMTTELYQIIDCIQKAMKNVEPLSNDSDINALEENFMQQRHILVEARDSLQKTIKDIYLSAASRIKDIGMEASNLLAEGLGQNEVEEELTNKINIVKDIIKDCQNESKKVLESKLVDLDKNLEVNEETEFNVELKINLINKFNVLPDNVKQILNKVSSGFKVASQKIIDSAYKEGINGGLKLTNFSGSTIHDIVRNAGKTIGYKFKPWEAIKVTKNVSIGGQVLGVLGVGLSIFMQIKSDNDEDRIREELNKNQQNIRSQFSAAANGLEAFSRNFIDENITNTLGLSINDLDVNLRDIRSTRNNRNLICNKLESLEKDCYLLISNIHNAKIR